MTLRNHRTSADALYVAKRRRLLAGLAVALFCWGLTAKAPTAAAEGSLNAHEIEEIVVEGYQPSPEGLYRSTTSISRENIKLNAATSIADLLAAQANLSIVSFAGNSRDTRIDIRGSGDASASNILTIVDGNILASVDLAGVDLTTLPLDRIERIEVIRGANSVRYGGGASQGIIKITTRRAEKNAITVRSETGSFGFDESSITAEFADSPGRLILDYIDFASDGYRDHNEERSYSTSGSYQLLVGKHTRFDLSYARFNDRFELPGPLSLSGLESGEISPRESDPDRNRFSGDVSQERFGFLLQQAIGRSGELDLTLSKGRRNDRSIETASGGAFELEGSIATDSNSANINYQHTVNRLLLLESGLFHQNIENKRTDPFFAGDPSGRRLESEYRTNAAYLYASLSLDSGSNAAIGYRRDRTRLKDTDFVAESGAVDEPTTRSDWDSEALEAGLSTKLGENRFFASAAKTFRNPNADEIQKTGGDPLVPQTADRFEIGYERSGSRTYFSLNLFHFELENEILFRDDVNINESEPTKKQGLELAASFGVTPWLKATANAGFLNAEYRDGNKIPLVPQRTLSAQLFFSLTRDVTWSVGGRYLSKRFDGNDRSNVMPRLPSATLVDSKITADFANFDSGSLGLFFSVTNLFNEQYVTAAYSGDGYPHPTRALHAGITLSTR